MSTDTKIQRYARRKSWNPKAHFLMEPNNKGEWVKWEDVKRLLSKKTDEVKPSSASFDDTNVNAQEPAFYARTDWQEELRLDGDVIVGRLGDKCGDEEFSVPFYVAPTFASMRQDTDGPEFHDGCDSEGFRGGCERSGHTVNTCPNKPAAPVGQEPVKWHNCCDRSVPQALRYLADHERPSGGESSFNSAHLFQLAGEIEYMASQTLYAAPPAALAVDLEQFRDCVIEAKEVWLQNAENWKGRVRESQYRELVDDCDRLLKLIDQQASKR